MGEFLRRMGGETGRRGGELCAALSKLEAYAARFALIHHVVTRVDAGADDSDPVDRASIEAGATLARWFAYEAERVYAVCRSSDEERRKRRLIEYVQGRGGEVTARTLHKANRSRYPTPEAAEAALDALVKAGFGEWLPTGEGGRPSRRFSLKDHTPYPKSPESRPGAKTDAAAVANDVTPKGSASTENRGEKDTFGVNGVWGKAPKQKIEPMEAPSDRVEDGKPFGVSPKENGDSRTDESEGELRL